MAKQRNIEEQNGMLWSSLKREKVENPHNVYGWGVIGDIDGESHFAAYPTKEAAVDHAEFVLACKKDGRKYKVGVLRFEEVA